MLNQFQDMAKNAKDENASKYLLQKLVVEWLKFQSMETQR